MNIIVVRKSISRIRLILLDVYIFIQIHYGTGRPYFIKVNETGVFPLYGIRLVRETAKLAALKNYYFIRANKRASMMFVS